MRKGLLEFCVLFLISKKDIYASDIIALLKQADLLVVEGTLYPLLNRLKRSGLLQYEWKESAAGPPRKYYSLTTEGQKVLSQLSETWHELSSSINNLIQSYE